VSLIATSRTCRLIAGWLLVVIGAVTAPTPLPFGIVLLVVGLCLLAQDSRTVRGAIRRLRRCYPGASDKVDGIKHRLPTLLRRTLERTNPRRRPRFGIRRHKENTPISKA